MSGSTIGGVVGGVIGAYFGNPQLGWMIGSAIGGAIDPQVVKAPSIGDAQKQSSQPGVPRPVVYGHPAPFAGNIIDGEHKARKIKHKERQGKGGPVVVSERFILTSAVRICEGPIAAVARIWRNGEVVYDRRATADLPAYSGSTTAQVLKHVAEMRAKSASFEKKVRIYLGTETQLADPALEALHGVGNTPYYRGTAYMVIEDDDVTDTRGAAAQYQFEVIAAGTEAAAYVSLASAHTQQDFNSGGSAGTVFQEYRTVGNGAKLAHIEFAHQTAPGTGAPTRIQIFSAAGGVLHDFGWIGDASRQGELNAALTAAGKADLIASIQPPPAASVTLDVTGQSNLDVRATWVSVTGAANGGGTVHMYRPAVADMPASWVSSPELPGALIGSDGLVYYPSWITPSVIKTISATSVPLRTVVEDIAARCNVPASKLDASSLTDVIPGFLIAQQFTGADTLRPTQQAFFYDLPEVDGKIRAVKRGGAAVVDVLDDDRLESSQDDERVRAQAVEYPLKVSVVTQDPAAEYAAIPQTSGRTSPDFAGSSEVVVELPIPFGAAQTAQIAHKLHKVLHSAVEGRVELSLPEAFSRYVPSDAFTFRDRRWLIEETRYAEGECHWKAVYDRASSYQSTATGRPPPPPILPTSGLKGHTVFAAMNLPRLRTSDNSPGMYIAARGELAGWPGAALFLSIDNGESFQPVMSLNSPATMGTLVNAASPTGEPLTVTTPGGHLASISAAQAALRGNGFAIVNGNVAEVGQFTTANETTPDVFQLTGTQRGQMGTTAAAHAAGSRFVLLDGAVQFLPIDISLAGKTLIFRPVTFGTAEANNPTFSVVYNPLFTVVTVDAYANSAGAGYVSSDGTPYYRIT